MSAVETSPARAGASKAPGSPLPVPKRALQRRSRPGLIALGVALVVVGALAAGYAVSLVGSTSTFLAVSRRVAVGAAVTAADLTTVRLSGDPSLKPVPASRRDAVVGRYAVVELLPDTLLTEAQLTETPVPGPGKSLVGLGLSEDQLPAGGRIKPGAAVTLVATATNRSAGSSPTGPPATFQATVVDVAKANKDRTTLVNVAVAATDAATVAGLAAEDRLVVVLAGR